MTDIEFDINLGGILLTGRPRHYEDGSGIGLGIDDRRSISSRVFEVRFFDYLCLAFAEPDFELNYITCFTRMENWKRSLVELPSTSLEGSLRLSICDEQALAEGQYFSAFAPVYLFDSKRNVLNIRLSNEESTEYYQVGANLIVGLSDCQLTELFLTDMEVIRGKEP